MVFTIQNTAAAILSIQGRIERRCFLLLCLRGFVVIAFTSILQGGSSLNDESLCQVWRLTRAEYYSRKIFGPEFLDYETLCVKKALNFSADIPES